MSIAAVALTKNEMGTIGQNVKHLLSNGVDLVLIADGMSTDGTRDVLADLGPQVEVVDDSNEVCRQTGVINALLEAAGRRGFDWIVPFDADEFVYACGGGTIAEALAGCSQQVVAMHCYLHLDWDRRCTMPRFDKMAFRWHPGAWLAMGAHSVNGYHGVVPATDVLAIREIQFLSREHFMSKIAARLATLDPSLPDYQGGFYREFVGLSQEMMESRWQAFTAVETVFDPVPSDYRV